MRSQRGQVLPLSIVVLFGMALCWVTVLNVGKLIRDRIQLQIAADTSAQTISAFRARGLNIAGMLNAVLGVPAFAIGSPYACFWPKWIHPLDEGIAVSRFSDMKQILTGIRDTLRGKSKLSVYDLGSWVVKGLMATSAVPYDKHGDVAKRQQAVMKVFKEIQTHYIQTYGGGHALGKGRQVARLQGADDLYAPSHQFSLGLKRNKGDLHFLWTLHVWLPNGIPLPPVPYVDAIKEEDESDDHRALRWLEQGPSFFKQRIRVYAFRRKDSSLNGPFPLGKRLFGIDAQPLMAAAAGRVFNPDGPMFPEPGSGPLLAPGWAATREYWKARGGYRAQLAPLGGLYEH